MIGVWEYWVRVEKDLENNGVREISLGGRICEIKIIVRGFEVVFYKYFILGGFYYWSCLVVLYLWLFFCWIVLV